MTKAICVDRSERKRRPQRGAVLVETAFVLTLALVFLLGIVEFGRVLMMRQLLDNAAP